MKLAIHLLGRPRVERSDGQTYRFRSRKSWAVLTYLLRTDGPPSRSRLTTLFFADAEDPMGALRWSLAEIRRALGGDGSLAGDPVVLRLSADVAVDVAVLAHGRWREAVSLPG